MSKPIPAKPQNPNGLHRRYEVRKADGSPVDPNAVYFVLRLDSDGTDPDHIQACRVAALAYSDQFPVGHRLRRLADELRELVEEIEAREPERA